MGNNKQNSTYKFLESLTLAMAKVVMEEKVSPGDNVSELEVNWSERQRYILRLFKRYSRILRTLNQLEMIAKLLEVKRSIHLVTKSDIKYADYMEYNLENYFMRITSIMDQSIILVSEFYNLGIPPQSTSLKALNDNIHTKDKKATEIIKSFDKLIQPIKKIRNLIAHRGEFNDRDVSEVEATLYMLNLTQDTDLDDPILDKMYERVESLIGKKVELVKNTSISLKKYIYGLDSVLNDENII